METITVKIVKKVGHASVEYKTRGSAGADIKAVDDVTIPKHGKVRIHTGLIMEIPEGFYGGLSTRSSLADGHRLFVNAGTIDSDYRGEIDIVLENFSDEDYLIRKGDRIAQIIFRKCYHATFVEDSVNQTERGDGGFGSTGK